MASKKPKVPIPEEEDPGFPEDVVPTDDDNSDDPGANPGNGPENGTPGAQPYEDTYMATFEVPDALVGPLINLLRSLTERQQGRGGVQLDAIDPVMENLTAEKAQSSEQIGKEEAYTVNLKSLVAEELIDLRHTRDRYEKREAQSQDYYNELRQDARKRLHTLESEADDNRRRMSAIMHMNFLGNSSNRDMFKGILVEALGDVLNMPPKPGFTGDPGSAPSE